MTLRTDAIAAFNTQQGARLTAARSVIATTLAPFDPKSMTVLATVISGESTMYIFTDNDMSIGVRSIGLVDKWEIYLVKNDGGWTMLSPIASLAQLGQIIPTLDPIVGP